MAYEFYLGVDAVNGSGGYAYAIIEKSARDLDGDPSYCLRQLFKSEGDLDAAAFAARVQNAVAADPYVGRTIIVVNRTDAAGRGLAEAFKAAGLSPVSVFLTAPEDGSVAGGRGRKKDELPTDVASILIAPERGVMSEAFRLYEEGTLSLHDEPSELASQAARGLELAAAGRADASAVADGPSVATAIACWYAGQRLFDGTERFEEMELPVGENKREDRTEAPL